MKYLLLIPLLLLVLSCSPSSSSQPRIPWNPGEGLEGVYQVVEYNPDKTYKGDRIITDFPYLPEGAGKGAQRATSVEMQELWKKLWEAGWSPSSTFYRIRPSGELVESFTLERTHAGYAVWLENGNYLMVNNLNSVMEVTNKGEVVRRLDILATHQAEVLENGALLVVRTLDNSFMEITWDGEVLFEWKAQDYLQHFTLETYTGWGDFGIVDPYNIFAEPLDREWTHINSAQKLSSGNYLASLRNLSLVVEIDKDTGEIVWSWGPGLIKYQHTPRVYGNYMYVFDNGNGRVVKMDRNTGRIVWEYGGILAPALGDVRLLPNGNVMITDSMNQRAIELDEETGNIVWEIKTEFIMYRVWVEGTW